LTDIIFTVTCGKYKSGCDASMKQIVEDSRVLLKKEHFRMNSILAFLSLA
jgi:hypothetical protein